MNGVKSEELIEVIRSSSGPLEPIDTGMEARLPPSGGPAVRAVLFDVYGTLFISASGDISNGRQRSGTQSLRQLLEHYHIHRSPEQLRTAFVHSVRAEHQRLKHTGIDFPEVRYEEIWATVLGWKDSDRLKEFATAYESIVNPVYPMPGLNRVLTELKTRGIAMGIISNAQFFTPLLFPAFLGKSLDDLGFDTQLCFYSYTFNIAKPATHMYLKAKDVLADRGIPPEAALYTGNDMLNDIYPARRAGFRTLLFAGDKRSLRLREKEKEKDERVIRLQADGVITQLSQLISCV